MLRFLSVGYRIMSKNPVKLTAPISRITRNFEMKGIFNNLNKETH